MIAGIAAHSPAVCSTVCLRSTSLEQEAWDVTHADNAQYSFDLFCIGLLSKPHPWLHNGGARAIVSAKISWGY